MVAFFEMCEWRVVKPTLSDHLNITHLCFCDCVLFLFLSLSL